MFTLFLFVFLSYPLIILVTANSEGIKTTYDSFHRDHLHSSLIFLSFMISYQTFCALTAHFNTISYRNTPEDTTLSPSLS